MFSLKDLNKSVCVQGKRKQVGLAVLNNNEANIQRTVCVGGYKSDSKNSKENKQEVWWRTEKAH